MIVLDLFWPANYKKNQKNPMQRNPKKTEMIYLNGSWEFGLTRTFHKIKYINHSFEQTRSSNFIADLKT